MGYLPDLGAFAPDGLATGPGGVPGRVSGAGLRALLPELPVRLRVAGMLILAEQVTGAPPAARLALLSAEERNRAAAFMFDRDRWLHQAAHSLKRLVLGCLSETAPDALVFSRSRSGRPWLQTGPAGDPGFSDFNLSHSGDRVALAVVIRGRVGVDVQEAGDRFAHLLPGLRHPDEAELFPQAADFCRMWALKEAVSKAIGTGLAEGFRALRLEQDPRHSGTYGCGGWQCHHHLLPGGTHLAVAADQVHPHAAPLLPMGDCNL